MVTSVNFVPCRFCAKVVQLHLIAPPVRPDTTGRTKRLLACRSLHTDVSDVQSANRAFMPMQQLAPPACSARPARFHLLGTISATSPYHTSHTRPLNQSIGCTVRAARDAHHAHPAPRLVSSCHNPHRHLTQMLPTILIAHSAFAVAASRARMHLPHTIDFFKWIARRVKLASTGTFNQTRGT